MATMVLGMSYTNERYGLYLDDVGYWRSHITRNVLAHVPESNLDAVLDLGCGAGRGTAVLARVGAHVIGVDSNAHQISAASLLNEPNCTFYLISDSVSWLKEHPSRFSLILLDNVVEHIPVGECATFLRVLAASLRPGGMLIVLTPNAASSVAPFLRYDDLTHTTIFTENSLRSALVAAGLESVQFAAYFAPGNPVRRALLALQATLHRLSLRLHGYVVERTESTLVALAKSPGGPSAHFMAEGDL
ncbi:MAG: methyltransferase family protein [Chthonomonadaceae bacterium]|nr:methyltransferase family protein [Chthonomonadaceae bacterium]